MGMGKNVRYSTVEQATVCEPPYLVDRGERRLCTAAIFRTMGLVILVALGQRPRRASAGVELFVLTCSRESVRAECVLNCFSRPRTLGSRKSPHLFVRYLYCSSKYISAEQSWILLFSNRARSTPVQSRPRALAKINCVFCCIVSMYPGEPKDTNITTDSQNASS